MAVSRFLKLALIWIHAGLLLATIRIVMAETRSSADFALYEIGIFAGGLLVLLLLHFFIDARADRRSGESIEMTDGMKLNAERAEIARERAELERCKAEIERQLDQRAQQLNAREVALTDRLVQFQEWNEYPQPERDVRATGSAPALLVEQDQRVIEILDEEAKLVYVRLKEGYYNPDGKLNPDLVRDQVIDLVTRVARVYRPGIENPLMETSVDQMLRAGSRACLHLLIVLDRLPLNLHEETLSTLHSYIRNAIKAWDAYSAAEPYLNHFGKAWYAGRYLAGASPLTMGISWALTEIGKRGAKAIGQKIVDQQAVALIGDVVRIVGFEVASVFSADFRHRNADWVYGSELTNLMSRYPVSRENLAHALREVGSLSLRNEYDRMFLYRCLSTHRSAAPLIDAHLILSAEQRQEIARRLEKFYEDFIHGRTAKRLETWREGVEERLGIPLSIIQTENRAGNVLSVMTGSSESASAIGSLAGFVAAVKGRPVRELAALMPYLQTGTAVDPEELRRLLEQFEREPPQLFEPPDIDPDSETLTAYLDDLVHLAVEVPPFDLQPDEFVTETAAYFGADVKAIQKKLDQKYFSFIADRLPEDAPSSKLSSATARRLIRHLNEDDIPQFVYGSVTVAAREDSLLNASAAILVGLKSRLLLIPDDDAPWSAEGTLGGHSVSRIDGRLIDDCRLSGGRWTVNSGVSEPGAEPLELTISGAVMNRYESWFAPILDMVRNVND